MSLNHLSEEETFTTCNHENQFQKFDLEDLSVCELKFNVMTSWWGSALEHHKSFDQFTEEENITSQMKPKPSSTITIVCTFPMCSCLPKLLLIFSLEKAAARHSVQQTFYFHLTWDVFIFVTHERSAAVKFPHSSFITLWNPLQIHDHCI